jgi:hypothetical protein
LAKATGVLNEKLAALYHGLAGALQRQKRSINCKMLSAELVDLRGLTRQMRCTLETGGPLALATPHELQCAEFSGKLSKVFTMTASVRSSSIEDGAPRVQPIRSLCDKSAAPFATVLLANRRRP